MVNFALKRWNVPLGWVFEECPPPFFSCCYYAKWMPSGPIGIGQICFVALKRYGEVRQCCRFSPLNIYLLLSPIWKYFFLKTNRCHIKLGKFIVPWRWRWNASQQWQWWLGIGLLDTFAACKDMQILKSRSSQSSAMCKSHSQVWQLVRVILKRGKSWHCYSIWEVRFIVSNSVMHHCLKTKTT